MLHRVRIEVSVLVALGMAAAALVLAVRAGGSETVLVAERAVADGPVAVLDIDFVPKGAQEVDIVGFAYDPDPVRIRLGQSVVWQNLDVAQHTVTADDGSWDSGMMGKGETVVMAFAEPGVYTYFCLLHPPRLGLPSDLPDGAKFVGGGGGGMQGTIIVEQGGK